MVLAEVMVDHQKVEGVDLVVLQEEDCKSRFLGIWNVFVEENQLVGAQMNRLKAERIGLRIVSITETSAKMGSLTANLRPIWLFIITIA